MVVMPADHVIRPAEVFQAAIRQAAAMVEASPKRIVTFGIKPSYPAEIFGYIHRGEAVKTGPGAPTYRVQKFQEKPDGATARNTLSRANTTGTAAFSCGGPRRLDSLRKRQPEMLGHLEKIVKAWDTSERDVVFEREFTAIKPISIDYAVMEHATDVAVIEAPFEWDDLGGWQSLTRLVGQDENANTIVGKHLGLGTSGYDRSDGRRSFGRHSGAERRNCRPYAECNTGGRQTQRGADSPGRRKSWRSWLVRVFGSWTRRVQLPTDDLNSCEFSYDYGPTTLLCRNVCDRV